MSSGNQKKKRSERVASVELPPGTFLRTISYLRHGKVLLRLILCVAAGLAMWLVTRGWSPPFAYRTGQVPARDFVARTQFQQPDPQGLERAREAARERARSQTLAVYSHEAMPLEELRHALKNRVFQVLGAETFANLEEGIWEEFLPPSDDDGAQTPPDESEQMFEAFRAALAGDSELVELEKGIERAFVDFETNGLLETLQHDLQQGSVSQILVYPLGAQVEVQTMENLAQVILVGQSTPLEDVDVSEVRIVQVQQKLREDLTGQLQEQAVADPVYQWFAARLPTTLIWDEETTRRFSEAAAEVAASNVAPSRFTYEAGQKLPHISAGQPLDDEDIEMLRLEHDTFVAQLSHTEMICHSLAGLGMYVAVFVLCGFYIFHRERLILIEFRRFATILGLLVLTIVVCWLLSGNKQRAELVPLVLMGITVTIAYHQELALLLSAVASLIVVLTLGQGVPEFVIYVATAATGIQMSRHIRSRTKLIYVGIGAGIVALATAVGVQTVAGAPFGNPLLISSLWYAFCAVLAALLMTGLLPFIERLFDVQTEISLLELGDAAHPLLQELVRRAPGTYNHSINVASIAEAAAEAIGANGLLVRVGAYFHDIGKMLKPIYFAENQGQENSRHESLVPAMSTLVIIAHVKDGADLARQHHLPQSIIDFVEQHHGTTLVEYFYDQAKDQSKDNPDSSEVEESSFRYPGPKPQSKEAAVMMLADAVESASRTLVEPTPARIESLVEEMAMKRLLDGQFDDSGLTLSELKTIEDSLVKSLTAVYHGRVKYPDQQQSA